MLASFNNLNIEKPKRSNLFIFGSTGSIGSSTFKILNNKDCNFKVVGLSCNSNWQKLLKQINKYKPDYVAITSKDSAKLLEENLSLDHKPEIFSGDTANDELAERVSSASISVAAISGFKGLSSTLISIKNGGRVLLANKESIVTGAHLIANALEANSDSELIPVDSEHSALFQLLDNQKSVASITLTASGGPFLNHSVEELRKVELKEALKHPNWDMGPKITIDSSTLVNKALEVVEAHFLFGFSSKLINVVIHPQSIVHSLVDFSCGTQLLHSSYPDMMLPIAYGLSYPDKRYDNLLEKLDLPKLKSLNFFELDEVKFPAIKIAKACIDEGVSKTSIFNSANEVAVSSFMDNKIKYYQILEFIDYSLNRISLSSNTPSIEEIITAHKECESLMNIFIKN